MVSASKSRPVVQQPQEVEPPAQWCVSQAQAKADREVNFYNLRDENDYIRRKKVKYTKPEMAALQLKVLAKIEKEKELQWEADLKKYGLYLYVMCPHKYPSITEELSRTQPHLFY